MLLHHTSCWLLWCYNRATEVSYQRDVSNMPSFLVVNAVGGQGCAEEGTYNTYLSRPRTPRPHLTEDWFYGRRATPSYITAFRPLGRAALYHKQIWILRYLFCEAQLKVSCRCITRNLKAQKLKTARKTRRPYPSRGRS